MSDELRVPKRRAQVEVLLPGGGVRQVMFFLAEFAGNHAGHERLSDVLNADGAFLPALDIESDTMSFLARDAVAAARVGREWEPNYDELAGGEVHAVEITLLSGDKLKGNIHFVLPPERSRLLDHLNDRQPFVRLDEGDKVALVNKRHIARVSKLK
jgi:hypothetical protein